MDSRLTGKILGDYEVRELIGKGGMGEVYRGHQISLDRDVAIKVLLPELCANREYVDRFLREARAAANLNHANVTQVFDAGMADGVYFFVMEFVDGNNIGQIIRDQGQQPELEALYVIQQSAEGLAYAHQKGIVHRDVKPENIMITAQGAVKIGDLGLAKWKPTEAEIGLTHTGSTMGTPFYISPEQIRGQTDIDGRADIYSLGMTFYHMLSGKPPFNRGSAPEIMAQHLSERLPPLAKFNPNVSRETIDLIEAMTAKKREDRISDMYEVADIIADRLGFKSAINRKTEQVSRNKKKSKPEGVGFGRMLVIGALLGVITIGLLMLWGNYFDKPFYSTVNPLPQGTSLSNPVQVPPPPPKDTVASTDSGNSSDTTSDTSSTDSTAAPMDNEAATAIIPKSNNQPTPPPPPKEVAPKPPKPEPKPKILPPKTVKIMASVYRGDSELRGTTVYTGLPNFNLDYLRNFLVVGKSEEKSSGNFPYETKSLIALDMFRDPARFAALLKMVPQCQTATLDLNLYTETKDFRIPRDGKLMVQVSRVLKKWGTDSVFGSFNTLPDAKKKEETNWDYACGRENIRWDQKGAAGAESDYLSKGTTISIDLKAPKKMLSIDILPELKQIAQQSMQRGEIIPHYGWVIQAVNGPGKVLIYPVQHELGPKVTLKIVDSSNDSNKNTAKAE